MHNHQFWARHFQQAFIPHLRRLHQTLEERLLPSLGDLAAEADRVQEVAFDRFNQMPADEDCDPAWPAEMAHEEALEHYLGMCAVRQTLLNAFAPILYHTWEQQLLAFHRREVLHPTEEHEPKLLSINVLKERLSLKGVELKALPSWAIIDELKHVANTVKHADGTSAEIVKTQYPALLKPPALEKFDFPNLYYRPRIYSPLSGDDIFLRETDLRRYVEAAVTFWPDFANALADA
ncbi:hypothetical protein [Jeongeupia chitinilytica]|uniref:Uncharacterized protein n=1 Tax=Jeongeupia chitinilytica TaxID=1041641 RepID=A0ABQ3GX91_9NEIS|nr:hypothetical protein [Jeongeupia chitinilytica]GHD59720.1 hypothetical protein GCM10007350_11350 [Jeongeupia chitinilytica]